LDFRVGVAEGGGDFEEDCEGFVVVVFGGDGGGGGEIWDGIEEGGFDVFGGVVDAVEDDEVLDAAGDVEVAVFEVAEVAGGEAVGAGEGGGGVGFGVPVSGGDGGS
jgi:hypothetical protein